MKKVIYKVLLLSIGLVILSVHNNFYAQDVMNINKKDNTTISIPVSDIQSITFSGNTPVATGNTIADVDGNVYPIVKIGHQVWMAENLRTTKYNDGTSIKFVSDYDLWSTETSGAYCYYQNNSDNKIPYGMLYNFVTVNSNKLCPEGWHVPFKEDWEALIKDLNGIPGAKLKEKGQANWIKNTSNVTNETGFTALPGGHRYNNGKYSSFGSQGSWWTATVKDDIEAYYITMSDYTSLVLTYSSKKTDARSIRCIRD